jgi:hypothetical protein
MARAEHSLCNRRRRRQGANPIWYTGWITPWYRQPPAEYNYGGPNQYPYGTAYAPPTAPPRDIEERGFVPNENDGVEKQTPYYDTTRGGKTHFVDVS